MPAHDRDVWLGDFSLVHSRHHFQSVRRDPQYEVLSGSKPLAFLWLVVAAAGGAWRNLVSGALWGLGGRCRLGSEHLSPRQLSSTGQLS